MFSKIKSYFSDTQNPETKDLFKHPQVVGGDASECPFMKNKNSNEQNNSKAKENKNKKTKDDSDTESEPEEKPRGGCPFMVSTGTKKNPNLGIEHEGFDEPFVSKFKYYLSGNKINFELMKKNKSQMPTTRHLFDKYPIYLKHTLFYNGEDFKKVRTFECCSRFMAYEELRQKGNKHFNKGRFTKAIDFYERAMSLFRWLEHREPEPSSNNTSRNMADETSMSEMSDNESMGSKIPIKLNQGLQDKIKQEEGGQFDEFRSKYKQFFVVYHDDNVAYFDGQQMTETVDIDMRKSLLIQIYLNMAATYIKLNHFSLANHVLEDARSLSEKVSQIELRKAQSRLLNKASTLKQLKFGLKCIQKAIQMQPTQKIFQNTNPNILKMVNIHDAKEIYQDVRIKLAKTIENKQIQRNQITESIHDRLRAINRNEQQIIKQGKVPQEGRNSGLLFQGTDGKILLRVYDKYVRIMEFYTEAKDKSQISLAKKEFQQVLKIFQEIKTIEDIEIDYQNIEFGTDALKIERRTKNIKRQKCQQIYNGGKYNFHVIEWAIKEIVKEEHEEKERKQKEAQLKKQKNRSSEQGQQKNNWVSKLPYAMVVIPIAGFIVNYLI